MDEFICFRSKAYPFKRNVENTNKLKGISKSQSKHNKYNVYKNCLDGEKYPQEGNIYTLKSINHGIYLQKIKKCTLSVFDDKKCYINNNESIPRK